MKFILLQMLLLSISNTFSQNKEIQKLLYSRSIDGQVADYQEVWILDDLIFRFNQQDTTESSLIDFRNNSVTINAFGRPKTVSIETDRKQINNLLTDIGPDTILYCGVPETGLNPAGEEISVSTDSIWFDKSVSMPKYAKAGFNGFLDNGFGYLPVRFVRVIDNHQTSKVLRVEFLLMSNEKVNLKRELLLRYLRLNDL